MLGTKNKDYVKVNSVTDLGYVGLPNIPQLYLYSVHITKLI